MDTMLFFGFLMLFVTFDKQMSHLLRLPRAHRWAPKIYKIGLTGGIGNGKSSALQVLGHHNHVTLGIVFTQPNVHRRAHSNCRL